MPGKTLPGKGQGNTMTTLNFENYSIVISQGSSKEDAPCQCGGSPIRKADHGHMTAQELDRLAGAKGKDVSSFWMECSTCGHITEINAWPKKSTWIATVEDTYGNYLTHTSDPSQGKAIKKAHEAYNEIRNCAFLGDC